MSSFWSVNLVEQAQELSDARRWRFRHEVNLEHLDDQQGTRLVTEDYHCWYDGWYQSNLFLENPESSFTAKGGDTYRYRGRCLLEIVPRKQDDRLHVSQLEIKCDYFKISLGEEAWDVDEMSLTSDPTCLTEDMHISMASADSDDSSGPSVLSSLTPMSSGPSDEIKEPRGGTKTGWKAPATEEEAEVEAEEDVGEEHVEEDPTDSESDSDFEDLGDDDSAYAD
jgi:hypothetical protein